MLEVLILCLLDDVKFVDLINGYLFILPGVSKNYKTANFIFT